MNEMQAMNIKGKLYIPVNERIKEFRTNTKYEGYAMRTEVIKMEESEVIMKAIIYDANDRVVAEGIAQEINQGMVNSTSMVENCETSCWGRALGNLGIGVDTSVASADEVNNAVNRQSQVASRTAQRIPASVKNDGPLMDSAPTDYVDSASTVPSFLHEEWGLFTKGDKLACPQCGGTTYVNQNKSNQELFIGKCKCGAPSVHLGAPNA